MKKASSLAYRNIYLGLVVFKLVFTVISSIIIGSINAKNKEYKYDPNKDITDCA